MKLKKNITLCPLQLNKLQLWMKIMHKVAIAVDYSEKKRKKKNLLVVFMPTKKIWVFFVVVVIYALYLFTVILFV